jgi:hypothetical protein
MSFRHLASRVAALVSAIVVAAALTAPAASADQMFPSNNDDTGSVSVVKHGQTVDVIRDGTRQRVQGNPTGNVGFTITEILRPDGTHYDLTDPATWREISTLTVDSDYLLNDAAVLPGVTDECGVAGFPEIPMGVYLITENGGGKNPATPVIITVPMINPTTESNDLNYDVWVYPKNEVTPGEDDEPDMEINEPPTSCDNPIDTPGLPEFHPSDTPVQQPANPVQPVLHPTNLPEKPSQLASPPPFLMITGSGYAVLVIAGVMLLGGTALLVRRNSTHG